MSNKDTLHERIDIILHKKNLFNSREKAQREIMAGNVFIDGKCIDKPGTKISSDAKIDIKTRSNPYVSRGGLKLEKALNEFKIDVKGITALDIGASTGGFTDCLLKHGCDKIYTIDVGYGQLDWSIKNNPKVICKERVNARYLKREDFFQLFDIIVIDVSFISLTKIISPAINLLNENGMIIALIKPQFEAGREKVGKGGIVRDQEVHKEVIDKILSFSLSCGLVSQGLIESPITGADGNKEFLIYLKKKGYHGKN